MNHKKFLATMTVLLLLGASAFAEIALKDLGGGKVSITFLFQDSSSEMGAIGSFNNWTVPGQSMTKNADGVWETTIEALATDEIAYKFYSKGTWIFDEMAPDKKDDGFGGFNGLIIVADILNGVTPMKPGAAAVAAKAKKGPPSRPKVTFGTETSIESDTAFDTNKGNFAVQNSAINAKSVWKLAGDLVPNMPGRIEITTFNGHSKVMDGGNLTVADGLWNLGSGMIFHPVYYLGGNAKPALDKFMVGIDSPYLHWETGYANSLLPAHKSVLWDTVSDENKAEQGYSSFRIGPKARSWGDFTIDAALVPNKSLDGGFFGLYSWLSAEAYGVRVEAQYDMKAAAVDTKPDQYFKNMTRQDFIAGAEAYVESFVIKGQFLLSRFAAGGTTDSLPAKDRSAAQIVAGYADVYKDTEVLLGWSTRGSQAAQMLYAKNDDVLGAAGTQKLSLTGFQNFGYWGTFKHDSSVVVPLTNVSSSNSAVSVRPGFVLNLDKLELFDLTVEAYATLKYHTKPAAGLEPFFVGAAGTKWVFAEPVPGMVRELTVFYQLDNADPKAPFNTLLADAKVAQGFTAQAGVGLRSGPDNPVGIVLGAVYAVPVPEAKTPSVYAHFVYNMDPYKAEGNPVYELTDFGPKNGASGSNGSGALRVGVRWDY